MKSLMPPEAYIDESWFLREQKLLFGNIWQFIAPYSLLSKTNAFVRRRVSGIDIIVQNASGQIIAYENVCRHRLSPIQNEDQGVRAMVCPYHGWSYDENGFAKVIPFENECYRFSAEERMSLKLNTFHIYRFGSLIFINLSDNPINFYDQFDSNGVRELKDASDLFDSEILVTKFRLKCNWKLIYENLRDPLHPRFVHSSTIYRHVKFKAEVDETAAAEAKLFDASKSHSRDDFLADLRSFSGGGKNEPMPDLPSYQWHQYVERYGQDDWYLNWLMFPNLHIASGSAGYSFIIEHHIPISAAQTEMWVYYVTGKKKRKYPTSAAVLLAHIKGAETVLREDFDIMEKVQSAITANSPPQMTGDYEYQNMLIEKWYLSLMEGRHGF
ncbi:Rieske 2Fe-2S domain-containing protein [Rhizobiales bacterium TNE-4]|nr:Rieske 2Fe-2S domain-containing protein [Rhizobiales bacterium TNE-4]MBV1828600.1 Rieske 2Fe-2S domain-containing protein [Rhizobiales bacterium TNE-4]